jgi:protein subunit release factor A|tara:strand:+ start:1537 stop:1857 length:321 start_codon:yes stop_codon:yes gene_type:complete
MVLQQQEENDYLCNSTIKFNIMKDGEKTKLEAEELAQLQELQNKFQGYKMQLGELEMQKSMLLKDVDEVRVDFNNLESKFIEKYGLDSVINIKTGEITPKENGEDK